MVNFSINFLFDSVCDSGDNGWENSALDEWNEDRSDLGNKPSGKFDINIIWADGDVSLLNGKFWCDFIKWKSWLGLEINFDINTKFLDVDFDLTRYCDKVFV